MRAEQVDTDRTASLRIAVSAHTAHDWLISVRNHERLIPFTRIAAPARPAVIGDVVAAVSVGVLRDVMVVTDARWETLGPACGRGVVRFAKTGPVLFGWAILAVHPLGPDACLVRWSECIRLRGTSGALLSRAAALMAALALHRTRRLLERHAADSPARRCRPV